MPTLLCGSLSRFPSGLGASMHRAAYAALGLDYAYVPFQVADLSGAVTGMRALGIRGFGVSMPFKVDIIPKLDSLDPLAERIGAVNTVVNDGGRLTGFNTDALGARRALEEQQSVDGATVVLLGAGGAARAIAFALVEAKSRVYIANRTLARAKELAQSLDTACATAHLGGAVLGAGALETKAPRADILVNASAGGMANVSDESPAPPSLIESAGLVMDIVYRPMETALLRTARELGKKTIDGSRMLLHQAAAQFELYTGRPAPLRVMADALDRALSPERR